MPNCGVLNALNRSSLNSSPREPMPTRFWTLMSTSFVPGPSTALRGLLPNVNAAGCWNAATLNHCAHRAIARRQVRIADQVRTDRAARRVRRIAADDHVERTARVQVDANADLPVGGEEPRDTGEIVAERQAIHRIELPDVAEVHRAAAPLAIEAIVLILRLLISLPTVLVAGELRVS